MFKELKLIKHIIINNVGFRKFKNRAVEKRVNKQIAVKGIY